MLSKDQLPEQIVTDRTIVRRAVPDDFPLIAAWPGYPHPHEWAEMCNDLAKKTDGRYWWERIELPENCQYSIVQKESGEIVGVYLFSHIDWDKPAVGNMGIRIRPDLCEQGYASETLKSLLKAVLNSGIQTIRLDVAATNARAIHCYEKCGMQIVDEFWREGNLVDFDDAQFTGMRQHFRPEGDKWMVRFYWLEIN
ncbi:MAG: GNAT family N-acetyltransferase [Phycisphaerae bacterium]|nr:GNAT family N-acetyltransferase [Phycisphaerae bacterium]